LRQARAQTETLLAQYADFYDFAPVGYLTLSEKGLILKANLPAATQLGTPRGALLKQRLARFILPEDKDLYDRQRQLLFETGQPQMCELRLVRPNRASFWARLDATFAPDEADGVRVRHVMMTDISQRKQAEAVLQESEERYRSLVASSMDAVLLTSPEGRILSANQAACRMFGRSEPELIQVGRRGVVDSTDSRLALVLAERARKGQYHGELGLVRKDGTRFPGEVSSVVFASAHGEVRTSMVIRDITNRKQAEQRVRMFSHEIITAREEERKQVSSVLHHDVGSLAVGLSAYLDAIEGDLRSGKPGEALMWIKRTRKLFDESVARLKAVAVQLRPPELDALGLCAALRQYFSLITRHGGTRIHFREGLGRRRVSGDTATTLFRIAQEALSNAIKHGHARQVDVDLEASKLEVRMTVRDNGKGFDLSEHRTRANSQLGLRVMQEMAAVVVGDFEIDSQRRKGTTVRVRLPMGGG